MDLPESKIRLDCESMRPVFLAASEPELMQMSPYLEVARRFGDLIAKQDYAGARALLTDKARAVNTPDHLREAVEAMTGYAPGSIREVLVMEEFVVADWPEKQHDDVAVAHDSLLSVSRRVVRDCCDPSETRCDCEWARQ